VNTTRLIAEIGANHLGDLNIARAMVDAAADAGCDTVKFQSWRPEKLVKSFPEYDAAFTRHSRTVLTDQGHAELIEYCGKRGVRFLTTCFDIDRIDFLKSLGLEEVKVASPDCASIRMLERLMAAFPHLIISTGMTEEKDVLRAIDMTKGHDVVFLHCVSLYPTPPDHVNLARMQWLKGQDVRVGFSDHTMGVAAAMLAAAQGAEIIEKHFTLSRSLPGKDQTISGEPSEFRAIAEWIANVRVMTGERTPALSSEELRLKNIYVGKWGNNL
jgi:N,N'-diacetyllegionaminate synthase